MTSFPKSEFWDFSLAVYARPGVAPACLALQERHGADINLLLFCCWLGASGQGAIEGERLARAARAVEAWHREVVRGLRAVRTHLKGEPGLAEALRKNVLTLELEAEHAEQLVLAGLAPALAQPASPAEVPPGRRLGDAAEAARAYLARLGAPLDEADRSDLLAVLGGAFPELARSALEAALAARG